MNSLNAIYAFINSLAPFLVILNFILMCGLFKKTQRFETMLKMYKNRVQLKLEKDTLEALQLLRSGKTEEARQIAERIINS